MHRTCRVADILFFGAGKKGKYWLRYCKDLGIVPKGIIDNNVELFGEQCEGIKIYSPSAIDSLSFAYIFITCNREEEIFKQLLELGVSNRKIVTGLHNFINHFLYFADYSYFSFQTAVQMMENPGKIIFDLQNGMVLGGVETWVYSIAKVLKKIGCDGLYLASDAVGPTVIDETFPVKVLQNRDFPLEKDRVSLCVRSMIENLPCTIICNFPQDIFWSACIVKRMFPDLVRIIAVQHSDDQVYYEAYGLWKNCIDRCMVISSRIEKELLLSGMDKNKLSYLEWKVNCLCKLNKKWNTGKRQLQLGYAGRLTTISKRVDLLPLLAIKLRERDIDFQINIAGEGDYKEILQSRIKEENLENDIVFAGYIPRDQIPIFWNRQDIMISCSECEGHSISQSEAMAEGAVPVITDVSGAHDDVTDGVNGYIVPVGDLDALADKICYLYHNRGELERMGKQAHHTIWERQKKISQAEFWNDLLRNVWKV